METCISNKASLSDMHEHSMSLIHHIDDFMQNCSNSIANALELQQSYTQPLI